MIAIRTILMVWTCTYELIAEVCSPLMIGIEQLIVDEGKGVFFAEVLCSSSRSVFHEQQHVLFTAISLCYDRIVVWR